MSELFSQESLSITERLKNLVAKIGSGDELLDQQILTNQLLAKSLDLQNKPAISPERIFVNQDISFGDIGTNFTSVAARPNSKVFIESVQVFSNFPITIFYRPTIINVADAITLYATFGYVRLDVNFEYPVGTAIIIQAAASIISAPTLFVNVVINGEYRLVY